MACVPFAADIAAEVQALISKPNLADILQILAPVLVLVDVSDVLWLLPQYLVQLEVVTVSKRNVYETVLKGLVPVL